eukprot:1067865-Prymnesium_polylepis.1
MSNGRLRVRERSLCGSAATLKAQFVSTHASSSLDARFEYGEAIRARQRPRRRDETEIGTFRAESGTFLDMGRRESGASGGLYRTDNTRVGRGPVSSLVASHGHGPRH